MHLQVLDFFEVGERAHFMSNPSSYINMQRGAKDFCVEASVNAKKRFLNEKRYENALEKLLTKNFFVYNMIISCFLGLGGKLRRETIVRGM